MQGGLNPNKQDGNFSVCDKEYDSEVDRAGNALEVSSNLIALGGY